MVLGKYWVGICTSLLLMMNSAWAADIEVKAILGQKAVVVVDGKQHMLAIGTSTPDGVKLVSIENSHVLLEINGRLERHALGVSSGRVKTTYKKPRIPEVIISATPNGMYQVDGAINGKLAHFLVDTGATYVALNAAHAKKLGVDFKEGKKVMMSTAAGLQEGFIVKLNNVAVGGIELFDVEAVVNKDKEFPEEILLGMSFLGRLEMQHSSSQLILRKRF